MPDIAIVRKRLRQTIDTARKEAALRRERADAAHAAFERFLEETATPAFRALANALRGEGLPFEVMTPSGAVRLVPDRNRDEGIALELDAANDPPIVLLSITKGRGSRMTRTERPVSANTPIDQITEDDLVAMLLEELKPWMV
jgi:hypothetical protein